MKYLKVSYLSLILVVMVLAPLTVSASLKNPSSSAKSNSGANVSLISPESNHTSNSEIKVLRARLEKPDYSWREKTLIKVGDWANSFAHKHPSFDWSTEHWYVPSLIGFSALTSVALAPVVFPGMASASTSSFLSMGFVSPTILGVVQHGMMYAAANVLTESIFDLAGSLINGKGFSGLLKPANLETYTEHALVGFVFGSLAKYTGLIYFKGTSIAQKILKIPLPALGFFGAKVSLDFVTGREVNIPETALASILTVFLVTLTESEIITGRISKSLYKRLFTGKRAVNSWKDFGKDVAKDMGKHKAQEFHEKISANPNHATE